MGFSIDSTDSDRVASTASEADVEGGTHSGYSSCDDEMENRNERRFEAERIHWIGFGPFDLNKPITLIIVTIHRISLPKGGFQISLYSTAHRYWNGTLEIESEVSLERIDGDGMDGLFHISLNN